MQIMQLFCAFVRHPTKDNAGESAPDLKGETPDETSSLREDVQAVMQAIANRKKTSIALEQEADFRLDFSSADLRDMDIWSWGTDLSGSHFQGANLSDVHLVGANLFRAEFEGAILSNANLGKAILTSTNLVEANLSCANLAAADLCGAYLGGQDLPPGYIGAILIRSDSVGAKLSGAYLGMVKNLTQLQLDGACAALDNPPVLDGAVDAETGMPLVWRGRPLDDKA